MASSLIKTLILSLALAIALAQANPLEAPGSTTDVIPLKDDAVLFVPPSDWTVPRVLYARTVELTHSENTVLATWENYSPEAGGAPLVYFPIYRSTDRGASWAHISNVTDQVNGWGLRYQPFLYELPEDFAGFAKGTVFLAGNSIPTDLSHTQIDLYASRDGGATWEFVSHVAAGGQASPKSGCTPVWEPFIMLYNHQLVIYYSDQRDPAFSQRLVHQTSPDGVTWGPVVPDVEYPDHADRPGMATVAQLPTGDYILAYEYGHRAAAGGGGGDGGARAAFAFEVTYRISADPLAFAASPAVALEARNTGRRPHGSPAVVWSAAGCGGAGAGGANGTLVVTAGTGPTVFTNTALGAPGEWLERAVPAPTSYTRHLRVFGADPDKLLIMGAGRLPPSQTNRVTYSIVSIQGLQEAQRS